MNPSQQNLRVQKWVAAISVLLLIIKFIAYYFTHSVSILTDALESIVNVVAGFIGLYSLYIAAQPRDVNHPYGHGKAEFLSAAVEGILIGIAGLVILYEAIHQLINPAPLKKIDIGLMLIAATAIINFGVGAFCVMKGKKNNSLALEASGKHLQTDTYSTIAVVAGLLIIQFTGLKWVDAFVAILLALFIIYTSYTITRKSIAGIMDEADAELLTNMIGVLNDSRSQNWVDLHNLRVIKYGSVLHVDAHLTVPWFFNVNEAHVEVDKLSDLIRNKYGNSLELFIHSDGCLQGPQCRICIKKDCPVRMHANEIKIEWTLQNIVKNKKHDAATTSLNL